MKWNHNNGDDIGKGGRHHQVIGARFSNPRASDTPSNLEKLVPGPRYGLGLLFKNFLAHDIFLGYPIFKNLAVLRRFGSGTHINLNLIWFWGLEGFFGEMEYG